MKRFNNTMNNWLRQPKSIKVAKYVECYWLIEKHPQTNSYQYPKLTPDPAAHLVISPTDQIYHYDMNPGLAKGKGSYLLFPHHQTFELDHSKPFVHLGIKFRVGALYSLDIVNDSHLTLDAVEYINITELLNIDEFNAIKLIDIARNDPDLCCKQLDALLLPWLEKGKEAWLQIHPMRDAAENPISSELLKTMIADYSGWHWLNRDPQKRNPEGTIEMMESIEAPTLIVAGEYSHPALKDLVLAQSRYIPNSKKVTIENSNHMLNIENPSQFNEELEAFLLENGIQ